MTHKFLRGISRIMLLMVLLCACCVQASGQYLLNESFEGTTFPPTGWTTYWAPSSATSTYLWKQIPTASAYPALPSAHTGSYSATSYNFGNYATIVAANGTTYSGLTTNEFVTPALPLQTYSNGYALISLWIYRYTGTYTNSSNSQPNNDKLSIYVSTSPTISTNATYLGVLSEYTTVGSFFPTTLNVTTPGWYQYSFSIPTSFNNAPAYVIFQDSSNYGYSVSIDDVTVKWIAPCTGTPGASSISTAALTAPLCSGGSMTLAAADPNTAANVYTYWQQSTTGAAGSWTTIPGTFGPLNISGTGAITYTTPALTNTMYYRFSDSCGVSSQVSYSPPYTVTVNTYSIPYTENFNTTANTSIPFCFTSDVTGSGQSRWVVNTQFHDAAGIGYTVISEDDVMGNFQYGKNAYFTLPALSLNAGQTYRIKFGYERGRSDANTTNTGLLYPENLALYENYGTQPANTTGIPGGASAIPLFASTVTTDGHNVASLTFTPSISGAYFFSWYSNTPHPLAGVSVAGGLIAVDSIKIDSFGCNPPVITFQPQNSAVCLGSTANLNVSASGYGLTYQWYKNNALLPTATASVLNIANAQAGDAAQYRVTVTGTCGGVQSVQSNTVNLLVSNYPTDSVATNKLPSICAGDSVILSSYASSNSFQWKLNGNFIPNAFSSGYTVTAPGTYCGVVTNQYGCATTSNCIPVSVLSAATVTISPSGPTTFCNGNSVTLTANTGTGISYSWLMNGVAVIPADTTNILTASTTGNYTIVEKVLGNGCTVTFPTPVPVIVNGPAAAPAIAATGTLSFCLGGFVTLTTPTITPPAGQSAYSYLWYKDSVAISGAQATTTSYTASASGKYFVSVSQNNCALKSVVDTVKVDAPNTTVINNGTIICSNNTIVLQAAAGLSYKWYNNNIFTGVTTQTYSSTTAGNFQVEVTDAFPCIAKSSVTTVTVGSPPSAVILASGPTLFCPGDSVKIRTNYDTSLSYVWSISTAGAAGPYTTLPSIVTSPTGHYDSVRVFKTSGYYRVTEANGPCQSTSTPIQVTVSAIPMPTILSSGSDSLCPGGSVTLSTQLGNTNTYQWIKNAVNISTAISAAYLANSAGSYQVVATNATGCKGVSPQVTVSTYNYPADSITSSGSDTICAGTSLTLATTAGAGYTYQWTLNNLPLNNANQSFYNVSNAGAYKVTVTSAQGCVATTPVATIVSVLPVPSTNVVASGPTTFCSPGSVTLSVVNGAGLTYQWQDVSGMNITNILGATSPNYTDTVNCKCRAIISNGICAVASIVVPVTVNIPPPVSINVGGNTTFCQGGNVLLSAGGLSGSYTYQWKLGNGNINTGGTLPSYSATAPGIYTLLATSGNCVSTSAPVTVKVNALPKDTVELSTIAGNRNPGCAGTPVVLDDKNSAPGFSYQWKLNGGNVGSNGTSVAYAALSAGMYSFSVTDTNGCTNASGNSMHVTFDPLPNPTIASNGNGSTLTTGTFVTYQWQLNGVNISGATANGYTVLQPGKYRVIVTNSYGCTGISDEYTSTVGVGSVSKADVRIYPNPVTSVVHIDAPVKVNVTISALDGKKIVEGRGVNEVDLSGLANGVYLITVYDENNIAIKIDKLVKTN